MGSVARVNPFITVEASDNLVTQDLVTPTDHLIDSQAYDIPSPASSEISLGCTTKLHASTKISKSHYVLRKGRQTIYTAGRPPWYAANGQQFKEAFVIGLCGGSASGKTTVANNIIKALDIPWVVLLSMDSFYRDYGEEEKEAIAQGKFNFDHPSAIDFDSIVTTLTKLKHGRNVQVPVYNFTTHSREKNSRDMYGANVIIFEGIHAFFDKRLTALMDMKIFVDTDADVRLARRLSRDITDRGRDMVGVLSQYESFVKPSFTHYIAPTMAIADIIVPRGGENVIALELIVDHIKVQLQQREFRHRTTLLKTLEEEGGQDNPTSPQTGPGGFKTNPARPRNLSICPASPQITGLHTCIRDKICARERFIFYSHRLSRIALEYAFSFLPHQPITIDTPQNQPYEGTRLQPDIKICGVSIIRAGETMEHSLHEVCRDVRLGKILIQTNFSTGEPELYYLRLPRNIASYRVLLLDPTVATGATAMMAIRVLLDHDVPEDNIQFVTLLMSETGAQTIAYAFPKVQIITTCIDPGVSRDFYILPGIGNFGDRYYGTESTATTYEVENGDAKDGCLPSTIRDLREALKSVMIREETASHLSPPTPTHT